MEYKTKDIYEASALVASDLKLIKLEPENNFYWFVFENREQCYLVSSQYWGGELNVFAKKYADALKGLKDRLFARP